MQSQQCSIQESNNQRTLPVVLVAVVLEVPAALDVPAALEVPASLDVPASLEDPTSLEISAAWVTLTEDVAVLRLSMLGMLTGIP